MLRDTQAEARIERKLQQAEEKEFLSAKELGINPKQRKALILVYREMKSGRLRKAEQNINWSGVSFSPLEGDMFNMATWSLELSCGTVCCMGGTAERLYGKIVFRDYHPGGIGAQINKELNDLFYPKPNIEKITVDQAMAALRGYLTTGKPDWSGLA